MCEKSSDSFFNAVLWSTYFKVEGKNATFDEDLQQCLGTCFLQKFYDLKPGIMLNINLDTFERKMHLVNDLLIEKELFLRLYEKKQNLHTFLKKVIKK